MINILHSLGKPLNARGIGVVLAFILGVASYSALLSHFPQTERSRHSAQSPAPAHATESPDATFFKHQVEPILQAHCVRCHGAEKRRGGLRLDSLSAMLKGGDSGPAVVPHEPRHSLLIAAIGHDDTPKMPPAGKLPDDDIKTLTAWVAMGAPWPAGEKSVSPRPTPDVNTDSLWSLQPLKPGAPPEVKDPSWPLSPIDAFILAKLEEQGLAPAPPAHKLELIRRVTFDLTGLPPTAQEIKAFLSDDSSDAFAKVVDRLLASPHYGEHWARHWLDLACYAETNRARHKPNAYRYRDCIIEAFNEDVPFNQFVIEQLAGDLLAQPRRNSRGENASAIAAGFLWMREIPIEECALFDAELARADYTADQIDQIGKTFLGLTIGCARCHVHKFDPISQKDYYGLAGFLRSSEMAQTRIAPAKQLPEMTTAWDKAAVVQRDIAARRARAAKVEHALERVDEYLLAAAELGQEATQPTPESRVRELAEERDLDGARLLKWCQQMSRLGMQFDTILGPFVRMAASRSLSADRFVHRLTQVLEFRHPSGTPYNRLIVEALAASNIDSLPALAKKYHDVLRRAVDLTGAGDNNHADLDADRDQLIAWCLRKNGPLGVNADDDKLPTQEREAVRELRRQASCLIDESSCFAISTVEGKPTDAQLHIRGNSKTPGPIVQRGFLKALTKDRPTPTLRGSGRLQLAEQIADANNPLTARVFVNRAWQHHFGEGLVRTPDNFGHIGAMPTHPELLDYLAAKFIESGWSIKALHRVLLMTRTYQMSSAASSPARTFDPDNKLLQHMPVRRLAAEELRDAMLAAAGVLDRRLYGHGTPVVASEIAVDGGWRRSVYLYLQREEVMPMLLAFDFPHPNLPFGRRHRTIVPAQALVLMNSEFVHAVANRWGARMAATQESEAARVEAMFWSALGRAPTAEEANVSLEFLRARTQYTADLSPTEQQSRPWGDLAHCLFNMNAFLFVR